MNGRKNNIPIPLPPRPNRKNIMNITGRMENLDNIQKFIHYSIQSLLNGIILE